MAKIKAALLGISAIAMTFSTAAVAQDEGGADVFAARAAARAERQEQRAERQAPVREQRSEARASWGEARAARQQEARQEPRERRMEARADNRAERQERRSARQDGVGYTNRGDAILARQGANRAADDARRETYERNRSYTDRNRDSGYGYGSRNDARRDRHRDWDRSAWRNDRRYDWRHWRERNRNTFHVGVYYSPYRDYRYRRLGVGHILQSMFFGQRYIINDPWRYRLPEVYGPYRWVRYYDDVMLVDVYNGRVVDVIHDFFW